MGSRSVQRSETTRPLVVCEARAFSSHRMQACHRLVRPSVDRSLAGLTCRQQAQCNHLSLRHGLGPCLGDTHFNLGPKHLVIIGSFFWRTVIHRNLERKNPRCVCLRCCARPHDLDALLRSARGWWATAVHTFFFFWSHLKMQ